MGVKRRRMQRKKFRYTLTAKRRQRSHKKKLNPTIEVRQIQKDWDVKKSAPANLEEMGLVYNLNKVGPDKDELINTQETYEPEEKPTPKKKKNKKKKGKKVTENKVADLLEIAANKKHPKQIVGGIRLPKDLVDFATMMLDKHGHNFKEMARDPTNYYQDSWKQIRTKIMKFVTNPRYFAPYLKERDRLHLPALPPQEKFMKVAIE